MLAMSMTMMRGAPALIETLCHHRAGEEILARNTTARAEPHAATGMRARCDESPRADTGGAPRVIPITARPSRGASLREQDARATFRSRPYLVRVDSICIHTSTE